MIKCFKKILVIALVSSISLTTIPAQRITAATTNPNIIENNSDITKSQVNSDIYQYVSTYNKETNAAKIEQYLISTGELVQTVEILGSETSNKTSKTKDTDNQTLVTGKIISKIGNQIITTAADSKNQSTYCNYEYTKTYGSPNTWELRRPDGSLNGTYYFKTKQTSTNKDYLTAFYDDVEAINAKESALIGAAGAEVFLLGLAGALILFLEALEHH